MMFSVQERGVQWKDQIKKWIRLYCRSKRTTPSNECHDEEMTTVTDGFVNGVTLSSSMDGDAPVATAQPNGQLPLNTLSIFIKDTQSMQETA